MRLSIIFLILFSSASFAQTDREGDLQLPVTDLGQIQKQEEKLPPTIDEVEMKQKTKESKEYKKLDEKLGPKNMLKSKTEE